MPYMEIPYLVLPYMVLCNDDKQYIVYLESFVSRIVVIFYCKEYFITHEYDGKRKDMTDINMGISLIKDVRDFIIKRRNKNKLYLNQCIDDLFQKTKIIVDDYNKILIELETDFLRNNMTIDEAIVYLEESRIPFKALRAYVSCFIEKGYYATNDDMEMFFRGILGVLQGGLERAESYPQRFVSDTFNNHTILDMIWECELLRNEEDTDELREILLKYTRKQMHELDNAWRLVCKSYFDLKEANRT